MKRILKTATGVFAVTLLLFCSSCSSDDPTPSGPSTHSLKGKVTLSSGSGIEDVVLMCGTLLDTTIASGEYEFVGIEGKSYTVTPSKTSYTFVPANKIVDITSSDAIDINFTGSSAIAIEMISVDPGTFVMGADSGWWGNGQRTRPKHSVTLTRSLYAGKYDVTQAQWEAVMGSNPSAFVSPSHPVNQINRRSMLEFCNALSALHGYTQVYSFSGDDINWNWDANGYRLPTEAEWEYIARAGTTENTYAGNFKYKQDTGLYAIAWWNTELPDQGGISGPRDVGLKTPNPWGFYDMIGNVFEACLDYGRVYSSSPVTDPVQLPLTDSLFRRGGSWRGSQQQNSCTERVGTPQTNTSDALGFRVVRTRN